MDERVLKQNDKEYFEYLISRIRKMEDAIRELKVFIKKDWGIPLPRTYWRKINKVCKLVKK